MEEFLTDDVWAQVRKHARSAKKRDAVVSYVTAAEMLPLVKGDSLVCDATNGSIKAGMTSARALAALHGKGVNLYSRAGLHAKVVIMGKTALVGSANLSTSSADRLIEACLLTDRVRTVSQCSAFAFQARENAERIDDRFIRKIMAIDVVRSPHAIPPKRKTFGPIGSRFWILRVIESKENSFAGEDKLVERGVADARKIAGDKTLDPLWVRFVGSTRLRREARPGDTAVLLWSASGSSRVSVWPPVAIISRQHTQKWTRLYYDETATHGMPWSRFKQEARRLGITSLKRNSTRQLSERDIPLVESIWSG